MGAKKVLLVDDEPDILELYSEILTAAGYKVTKSSDGVQALFKMRNGPFDLIITDIKMPRLPGDQMLSYLLAKKNVQLQKPIIISSAFIDVELVEKFKGKPHIGFLTKPATHENFLRMVKRLLRE